MVTLISGNSVLRRTISRTGMFLFLATVLGTARALPTPVELANIPFSAAGTEIYFATGGYRGLKLFLEIGGNPFNGGIKLFEDLTFGNGHSSGSFSADAASDPDFLNFTAKLSDGVNDYFSFMHGFVGGPCPPTSGTCLGGGTAQHEFQLFGGSDFLGDQITRIVFQVNSLDVVLSNPQLLSAPVGYRLDGRLIFEGNPTPIPEPATTLLMLTGFALIAGTVWRRRPLPVP